MPVATGGPSVADPVAWTLDTGGEYIEEPAWLTDQMNAPTGGSQHRRLRQSPRTSVSFSALESGARRRWMDVLLRAHGASPWWAPVAIDTRLLDLPAAASAVALNVTVSGARFTVGGHVLVVGADPRHFEVHEIASVGTSSLTLADPLDFAWPAGTQLVPVRRARLADVPSVGRFTADDSALVPLRFRLEEPLDDAPAIPGTPYRSFPVFDFIAPVWTSDPAWSPERSTDTVDDEVAVPFVADLAGMAMGKTTMHYAPVGVAAVAEFRAALFALAGRWAATWVPSWTHDLRVAASVSAGATTLDVDGPLASTQQLASNRRDVRIELFDGTVLYRRITAVSTPSASVDRLTVDSALPAFTAAQVRMVCYLSLSVQESDVNTLRYYGPDALQCELTWRELAHAL